MKALVTGGAGFIGSTLAKELAKEHEVLVMDNFSYGFTENIPKGVEAIDWDIVQPFKEVLGDWEADLVFHLAAIAPLPDCQANPAKAYAVNVGGTANVLEYASKVGARVAFASTSAVYENNHSLPFDEHDSISPDLIYSLTKKHAEDLVRAYWKNHNMAASVFRLFNVYGPAQDGNRKRPPYIPYLLTSFVNNQDITIFAENEYLFRKEAALRDYIYIDDVVSCLTAWIKSNRLGGIYNVCNSVGYSTHQIFQVAASHFPDYSGKITYVSPDEIWNTYPELFSGVKHLSLDRVVKERYKMSIGDNSYTKRYLKWEPKYSLEKGIATMLGK